MNVRISSGEVRQLLGSGSLTTVTGDGKYKDSPYTTFQATVVGTGVVTATVVIDCSNDNVYWCTTPLGTISLSGTTSSSDGFTTNASWKYIRARVTAVSGTGALVTANMGI